MGLIDYKKYIVLIFHCGATKISCFPPALSPLRESNNTL